MGNSSYINVIAFVIITILYYFFKPGLTLKREEAQKYKETRYVYLSIYLMVIILTQFFVNISIIKSTCGGNIRDNIGPAALFTFMPWLFIFGIMVVVLLLYPGFKSVFADVVGYFYISSAANEIITTLLINKDVEDAMDSKGGEPSVSNTTSEEFVEKTDRQIPANDTPPISTFIKTDSNAPTFIEGASAPPMALPNTSTDETGIEMKDMSKTSTGPSSAAETPLETNAANNVTGKIHDVSKKTTVSSYAAEPPQETIVANNVTSEMHDQLGGGKKELQDAAEIIVKICGNMSVLINQITPENFTGYWKILTPLMKPKYQNENNTVETEKLKNDLFQLVVTRDNVGESMWYIYAGILVTSIVQLKIATRGCVKSTAQMEKDYQSFLDEEAVAKANKDKLEETTYTL
jgi:hypothetical protein